MSENLITQEVKLNTVRLKYKAIKKAPEAKLQKPQDYLYALQAAGLTFSINDMDDRIYVRDSYGFDGALTDGHLAIFATVMGNKNYGKTSVIERACIYEAEQKHFNPIKDYLNGVEWDGQDHIAKLASYFTDKGNMFGTLLRKWLIGAVSKVMKATATEQNPMLVLAGGQGMGKTVFVEFLGSAMKDYYVASPIYPDNKDYIIRAAQNFIWEVTELGATTRRADIEALKAFLSTPDVSFRAPYGKFQLKKKITASFIGTVNGTDFLNDPTGNRRFRVCELTRVDWGYSTEIDPHQVWAQAVALVKAGETYHLDTQNEAKVRETNALYTVQDVLEEKIANYFEIDPDESEWLTTTGDIMSVLKNTEVIRDEADKRVEMRISTVLTKMGIEKSRSRVDGRQVRVWVGVRAKEKYQTFIKSIHEI
jgi:predicted P-loop ATPase